MRFENGQVISDLNSVMQMILARISASPAAYNLAPTEMVTLKKAGVSERVITAMVAAK